MGLPGYAAQDKSHQCGEVLNFIYKELSLNHLENSYEMTKNKFLLSLHYFKNNRKFNKDTREIKKILETLKTIDPKFKSIFRRRGGWLNNLFARRETLSQNSLKAAIHAWIDLQNSRPELFIGLPQKYRLNEFDSRTMELMDNVEEYTFSSEEQKQKIRELKGIINQSRLNLLSGKRLNPRQAQEAFENNKSAFFKALKDNSVAILNEFKDVCSTHQLTSYLQQENLVCPLPKTESDFLKLQRQIAGMEDILTISKPTINNDLIISDDPEDEPGDIRSPEPNVEINTLEYRTNEAKGATYCKRNPEIVTHIVIHHTATTKQFTPLQINESHLYNVSGGEPWYMVGYNYMISETFQGATEKNPKVFEGRKQNMQGSHAGGFTSKLKKEERDFYGQFEVECGNDTIGFKKSPALSKVDANGGIKGNLVSYGIAVIGNYAPLKANYVAGAYLPENIDLDSPARIMLFGREQFPLSNSVVDKTARLSCKLQKENKNIKTIVPHNYFKDTACPGSIIYHLYAIAEKAKEYGCHFEVKLSKGKK